MENSKNEPKVKNVYTSELLQQVETVIEKENKLVLIQDAPIEWEEYVLFKKNLLWIKRSDFVSGEKDDFIIHAHSLMNLFITAVFSMKTFGKSKEQGIIDIGTPQEKLAQLENWSNLLPEYVKEKADVIIRILNMTYSKLLLGTGKESWLYDFLIKNEYKKIAIVVPKAYYATIIRASINCSSRFTRNVCVTTPGRFDDTVTYDLIIAIVNAENEDIWRGIKDNGIKTSAFMFDATGSHYYSAIINRYTFVANIFEKVFGIPSLQMLSASKDASEKDDDNEIEEIERYKLNKPLPETLTIEDIIREMKRSRFLIRPPYQRSETKDLQKASYLMESILLGFTIPPIFVYKREDKVREVVDGQQRLLTILGYLSKTYLDENGEYVSSDKDKFKLSKLKILSEQNGKTIDNIEESFEECILEFPLDIIEIDGVQNPAFSPIDLFLRLNTKPYPIKENSFEMWNAYVDKGIVLRVKEIAKKYQGTVFRNKDNRMKLEELIISLAYLDYRLSKGFGFSQTVNVYKRNDRISARIMSKDQVTKTLGDVSNSDVSGFMNSVENVDAFAQKIVAIVSGDTTKIRDLVNHLRKGTNYKTDQNYYFLWALLNNISLEFIENNQGRLYKEIQKVFAIIQNTPEGVTAMSFVEKLEMFEHITQNVEYTFIV